MNKKLTYISLFSCAGVGCYGFKQQGFECIATNELDPKRLAIQKANQKCKYETGYIDGDITASQTKQAIFDEIKYWQEYESIESVDVLIATPPCQGMSVLNLFKKDETPRNSLIVEAISLVKQIQPKFFVFENVQAFAKTLCVDVDNQAKTITQAIIDNLSKDYEFVLEKMNFKDFGSQSSRPRTLTIGIKKSIAPPEVSNILTIGNFIKDLLPSKQMPNTVQDCIGHLPSLDVGEIDTNDIYHQSRVAPAQHIFWVEKLKPGESAFHQADQSRIPNLVNAVTNKFTRIEWDKPMKCITTRSDTMGSQYTVHPRDHRVLSIRELMIFQTIPTSFKWSDKEPSITDTLESKKAYFKKNEMLIRTCIGESVPTRIFEQIAQNIKNLLTLNPC